MSELNLLETCRQAVRLAQKQGAREAAADVGRVREVQVQWRDGKLEKITEATTRGLSLELYVDGRYSAVSTSDLRPDAIGRFVEDAVALARVLETDPHRALPDPELYQGRAKVDLQLEDGGYARVTPTDRLARARAIEDAARAAPGEGKIISVTTSVGDALVESVRVASNGFEGGERGTQFWASAEVSVQDPDGRRPEESDWGVARFLGELPDAATIGRTAAERARARVGARKIESAALPVLVENRAVGRLFYYLLAPLRASALQQKRSFLEGKLGETIGSEHLDVTEDPLLPRGLGSRLYDGEGIAARRFPVFAAGVLKTYFVDNYYGRKLGMRPTTAGPSNLTWKLGDRSRAELAAGLKDGVLVTGFLGGNSNATTGDFSTGVQGFRVRDGALAEPIAEVNLSGNHLEVWKRLVAVGNDPYPYSSLRSPSLLFDGLQLAGT